MTEFKNYPTSKKLEDSEIFEEIKNLKDYVYFLSKTNGMELVEGESIIYFKKTGENLGLSSFLPYDSENIKFVDSIKDEKDRLCEESEIFDDELNKYIKISMSHKYLIPIAYCLENIYICISQVKGEEGVIRLWDPETGSIGGDENLETQPKLANSFREFLKSFIDQNGGYIKGLSEVYEDMINQ